MTRPALQKQKKHCPSGYFIKSQKYFGDEKMRYMKNICSNIHFFSRFESIWFLSIPKFIETFDQIHLLQKRWTKKEHCNNIRLHWKMKKNFKHNSFSLLFWYPVENFWACLRIFTTYLHFLKTWPNDIFSLSFTWNF